MKNLIKSNPARFWFWTGFAFIFVLLTTSILLSIFVVPNMPAFSIADKKFTNKDIEAEVEANKQKAVYMDDRSIVDKDNIKKAMIEAELIEIIAKEKGVTVSDKDVDAKISDAQKIYAEETPDVTTDDVYSAYSTAYGYSKDQLRQKIRVGLLKEKLVALLVVNKNGRFVYTRFNTGNGVEEMLSLPSDKLEGWAKNKMDEYKTYLDQNDFDALYKMVESKYGDLAPATGVSELSYNGITASEMTKEEKDTLNNLKKGDVSAIVKTDATFTIYKIDEISGGGYESWNDVLKEYENKYVKKGFLAVNNINIDPFGIKEAWAGSCAYCGGCDGSSMAGNVYDSVIGEAVPGVTVTYHSDRYFCNGSTSRNAWCGYGSKTDTTDSAGYYGFSRRDGSSCFANCAGNPFYLTASKSGFNTVTYKKYPSNGHYYSQNFSLVPTLNSACSLTAPATVVSGANFTGTFKATNTGAIRWLSSAGFKLGSQNPQDNNTWGLARVAMPVASVSPGAATTFTINAKAPSVATTTTLNFSWRMLKEGYAWFGSTCTKPIQITVTPPPTMACTVTPETGLAPLVVKVEVQNGTAPFDFNMGDGSTPLSDRPSTIYYTYQKGGTYGVSVTDSSNPALTRTCTPNSITVKDPSDSSGGEVAP